MKEKMKRGGKYISLALRIAAALGIIAVIAINYNKLQNLDVRALVGAGTSVAVAAGIVLGVYALKAVVFVIPAMVIYTAVGLAFKTWQAIVINAAGILLEVILTWCLGRILGGKAVEKLLKKSPKGQKLLGVRNTAKYPAFFGIRVLPLFPIDFVSLFMGTTDMKFLPYVVLSFGGILPRVVLFTLLGDKIYDWFPVQYLAPTAFALVCAALIVWIVRYVIRMGKGKKYTYEPITESRRYVILDTDMGPDCDDAGALAVLIKLLRDKDMTPAGVVNCTSNPYSNGVIKAILQFCGCGNVPVGQTERQNFLKDESHYAKVVSEKYMGANADLTVLSAEELYVNLLTKAEEKSVVLVSIGMLNNIRDLLEKHPDLVRKKVYALVAMAGDFPEGREYNIHMDADSARYVFEHFPAPIICSGFAIGKAIKTGYPKAPANGDNNPIFDCYRLFCGEDNKKFIRESWDLTAVQFAAEGCGTYYKLSDSCEMVVDAEGNNKIIESPKGNRYYLQFKKKPSEIQKHLEEILHHFDEI